MIERLQTDLKIANKKNEGTLANNLCPDHRDKQTGKPCLACEIERLQKARGLSEMYDLPQMNLPKLAEEILTWVNPFLRSELQPRILAALTAVQEHERDSQHNQLRTDLASLHDLRKLDEQENARLRAERDEAQASLAAIPIFSFDKERVAEIDQLRTELDSVRTGYKVANKVLLDIAGRSDSWPYPPPPPIQTQLAREYLGENTALRQEIIDLRADLDWLETQAKQYRSGLVYTIPPSLRPGWTWVIESCYGESSKGSTLREALSNAREQLKKGDEK